MFCCPCYSQTTCKVQTELSRTRSCAPQKRWSIISFRESVLSEYEIRTAAPNFSRTACASSLHTPMSALHDAVTTAYWKEAVEFLRCTSKTVVDTQNERRYIDCATSSAKIPSVCGSPQRMIPHAASQNLEKTVQLVRECSSLFRLAPLYEGSALIILLLNGKTDDASREFSSGERIRSTS